MQQIFRVSAVFHRKKNTYKKVYKAIYVTQSTFEE
jgi:hypothetical protein